MAERFQTVYSLPSNLYAGNCPIMIEAGALHKDTITGQILAQLKMRNLGEKTIISCKVKLRAWENNGTELQGVDEFSYLDLNATKGTQFGDRIPVVFSNDTVRRFSVIIYEIVYSDNTVSSTVYSEWKPLPPQTHIGKIITNPELRKQYAIEVNCSTPYYPETRQGFFLCTCGAINLGEDQKCYRCGQSYESLAPLLDLDYLERRAQFRHYEEGQEKEKKKKIITYAGIAAVVLIVVIALGIHHHKVNILPFDVGDSFDTVKNYVETEAAEYDSNLDDYDYPEWCSGWFDYYGLGDESSQYVMVYSDDGETVDEIVIDVVSDYQNELVKQLDKYYDYDPSDAEVDESSGEIVVRNDTTQVTIKTGYQFNETTEYHSGENVIQITVEPR